VYKRVIYLQHYNSSLFLTFLIPVHVQYTGTYVVIQHFGHFYSAFIMFTEFAILFAKNLSLNIFGLVNLNILLKNVVNVDD
jgi:hypothetical protein